MGQLKDKSPRAPAIGRISLETHAGYQGKWKSIRALNQNRKNADTASCNFIGNLIVCLFLQKNSAF